ncbi:MAG TPA: secondary thiamine-phosphate synthase enzyme YjbQ [Bacteriovoracaceae bacterium]|nr:secondary thiamine-phosphate synthase enzyme YjbQ [Bacteriovoracaceae bacterium]
MAEQLILTLKARIKGFHLITRDIEDKLPLLPSVGLLHVYIKHTSAGLTINENADPTVRSDLDRGFDHLAPENQPYYQHTVEGADDMPAHIKSSLVGSSVSVPITNGKLNLGTWQGIYLCEFRTQATPRTLVVTILC